MKDYGLSIDFFVKRAPAYLALLPVAIMAFGHIYFDREVNVLIMYDMSILVGALFAYPRILLNGKEQSHLITKNIASYFILILFIIPGSLFEFFGYAKINEEVFAILTTITAVVFGLSKIELSRESVKSAITNYTHLKDDYKTKTNLTSISTEEPEEVKSLPSKLPDDLDTIKTKYKPTTLKDAAMLFIGTTEIKGTKHNKVILQFGKWAGINWYDKDEIPWCAVFVNAMLYLIGKGGTKSALAKSFLNIGKVVTLDEVKKDPTNVVAIYHRGSTAKDISGHVQIVIKVNNDNTIDFVTGNVSDTVKTINENLEQMLNEKLSDGIKKFIEFRRI